MSKERLTSRSVGYEPKFDKEKNVNSLLITNNLETLLGERLNVLLRVFKYEIKHDSFYGDNESMPFLGTIRKGVMYHETLDGENRIDRKRENAEVEGFIKIQEILTDSRITLGTMMVSISPPGPEGSLYKHNFYDIFTLKEKDGKKFVEARRYSSALSIEEYKDKLKPLSYIESDANDAYFLSHPIRIDNIFFENADQIHSYLHLSHNFMNLENFEQVLAACRPFIQEYIRTKNNFILDAIMNKADQETEKIRHNRSKDIFIRSNIPLSLWQEIELLGTQPVRAVAAGCGPSGSVSKDKKFSPFSASDFGLGDDKYGAREFDCPECGKTNVRPKDELIKNCQHCNSSKVAC